MEDVIEAVKDFILTTVNEKLEELADEEVSLPAIESRNVQSGVVDMSRYESPVVVSILPDEQEPEEGYIDDYTDNSRLVVTFLLQKARYSLLMTRMFRYAKAFRLALHESPSLNNTVNDVDLQLTKFFPDAGPTPQQMTAVELTLQITSEGDD